MKSTIKRQIEAPESGCRSKSTIGINLVMHHSFFAQCSSTGGSNKTYQPIPKLFALNSKEQLDARNQMIEAMKKEGYTIKECLGEWRDILNVCAEIATDEFIQLYGHVDGYLKPSTKADNCLKKAAAFAMSEMFKQVDLRIRGARVNRIATPCLKLIIEPKKVVRNVKLSTKVKVMHRDKEANGGVLRCAICKTDDPGKAWHVDHKIALFNEGSNEMENLQTLCAECNLGKGKMILH